MFKYLTTEIIQCINTDFQPLTLISYFELFSSSKMAKFEVLAADIIEVKQAFELYEKCELYCYIHLREESELILFTFVRLQFS